MDGGKLIGCFVKPEVVGKHFVVSRAETKRMAFAQGSAGINIEQFCRTVAHLLGSLAFGFFPLAATEFVQRSLVSAYAGIAADKVQLRHWHIQRGITRVFEMQELLQRGRTVGIFLAHVHVDQTLVAAYAVRAVHHRIAHIELTQILDQRIHIAGRLLLAPPAVLHPATACKQFSLGDQVNGLFAPGKTLCQCRGSQTHFFDASLKFSQRIHEHWLYVAGAQKIEQTLAPARTLG